MTLNDYIKFNTNYGDMNKGIPLKRTFLEMIYRSIQQEQLLIVDDVYDSLFIEVISSPEMTISLPLKNGMTLYK